MFLIKCKRALVKLKSGFYFRFSCMYKFEVGCLWWNILIQSKNSIWITDTGFNKSIMTHRLKRGRDITGRGINKILRKVEESGKKIGNEYIWEKAQMHGHCPRSFDALWKYQKQILCFYFNVWSWNLYCISVFSMKIHSLNPK